MSVPRAKKTKKKQEPGANPNNWQSRRITEAIRMCVAEAVWDGYNYYGYREKRICRIPQTYWDEMAKAREMNSTSLSAAYRARKLVDVDIAKECKVITEPYKRDVYTLCISVMVSTLKTLKWSRKRLTAYVHLVLASVTEGSVYPFIREVAKATGYDASKKIVWT